MGLSLSTKLAPARFHTQMVALYFLSVALGTAIAGRLAGYYDADDETGYFLVIGLVADRGRCAGAALHQADPQADGGVH